MKYTRAKLIINKIFNVTSNEWPRVFVAWLLKTFTMITYIMGWTFIVAVFVIEIGIEELPYLFIANGLLVFMGSVVYSHLVQKYSKEKLVIGTALAGVILFLISWFFFESNALLFFLIFLIAECTLLSQINILLAIFVEQIFTPLEAQRVEPIIETAEPIGGVIGGTLVTFLAGHLFIGDLVYFIPLFLLPVAVVMIFYLRLFKKIPKLKTREEIKEHEDLLKMGRFKAGMTHIRTTPFLKSLLIIVLCQWFFFSIVEFQFTKFVHGEITGGGHGEVVEVDSYGGDARPEENDHGEKKVRKIKDPLLEQHADEIALTQGLGMLHIFFGLLVLITRLFISSRLYQGIGFVKSSLLYPVFTLFATTGMILHPGYTAAVWLKGTTEVFGSIHTDAYHNSYYGLKEAISQQTKEFLEGIIRPIGFVLGTVSLIVLQNTVPEDILVLTINAMAAVALIVMVYMLTIGGHQEKYTSVSKRHIDQPGNTHLKFTALDVLSQRGHKGVAEILTKDH